MPEDNLKFELKLKVGELTERGDFGRGIVRISAKDMKKINEMMLTNYAGEISERSESV